MRTQPPSVSASGQPEQIKGVRRNMARVMADAHAKVVATTLSDDANIDTGAGNDDVTVRLIAENGGGEEALAAHNAWVGGEKLGSPQHQDADIIIADDNEDGLVVPVRHTDDVLDGGG